MKIYIFANHYRADAIHAIKEITLWLTKNEHSVYAGEELVALLPLLKTSPNIFSEIDLGLVFGGDGTLIKVAPLCAEYNIPLLGVNFGHLAFITQINFDQLIPTLESFIKGKLDCEDRMMVQAEVLRENQIIKHVEGLNEIVIHRNFMSHVISMEISIGGRFLTTLVTDGLIVASPTGSTAYNLSAGGPIVDPQINALVLTTISPHSLSARPIVLKSEALIEIKLIKGEDAVLSCDGQDYLHLLHNDVVRLTRSPRVVRLVCVEHGDFLKKLEEKFFWANRRSDI